MLYIGDPQVLETYGDCKALWDNNDVLVLPQTYLSSIVCHGTHTPNIGVPHGVVNNVTIFNEIR